LGRLQRRPGHQRKTDEKNELIKMFLKGFSEEEKMNMLEDIKRLFKKGNAVRGPR
jgi:hypothetical protein